MSEEEKTEKKGGKGLIFVLIGVLVVLIIVVAVVVILLLGGTEEKTQESSAKPVANKERNTGNSDYAKPGPIFAIPEPFIVNLVGQNGRRYAKTTIALEMSSPELQKEVTAKIPLIRDTIIRVLSAKTFEDVSTSKGKERLKEEITQELNTFMVDGYIKSVFLTEFVIQ